MATPSLFLRSMLSMLPTKQCTAARAAHHESYVRFFAHFRPLPILTYASEVWAVDGKVGKSAEQLQRQF